MWCWCWKNRKQLTPEELEVKRLVREEMMNWNIEVQPEDNEEKNEGWLYQILSKR